MDEPNAIFVGIAVSKVRNSVAIADGGRGGEIRYLGEVDATEESMRSLIKRITSKQQRAHFCYEAGPTGYGLYRLIVGLGFPCTVVAPSLIPRKPSDRVKTNRRDAVALARLLRAGELTAVWVPDEGHEAIRDLVCARSAAVETLRWRIGNKSALSCSDTEGYFRAKRHGALATFAGCKSRNSIIRPIRSRFRKWSKG